MKALSFLSVVLFAGFAQAAPTLKSMECELSNGVEIETLETEEALETGIAVKSVYGVVRRDFTAVLSEEVVDGNKVVELLNYHGDAEYFLHLPINGRMSRTQELVGTVQAKDLWMPENVRYVADATCEVTLN